MTSASRLAIVLVVSLAACGAPGDAPGARDVVDDGDPGVPAAPDGPVGDAARGALPHAMKGYTLYGWRRGGTAWFALTTSTNRLKSFDELDRAVPVVEPGGITAVRARGVEAARVLIGRVPEGTSLTVQSVFAPSVAGNTVPGDVEPPAEAHLAALRR